MIIMTELKEFLSKSTAIKEIAEYDSGTAVITEKPYSIYWFDTKGDLVFSTKNDLEFKKNIGFETDVHIYKINEWLKVYTPMGESAEILVEKRNYLMPIGSVFYLRNLIYSDVLKNIKVSENVIYFGTKKVEFNNNVNDVVYATYPQECVLIVANSEGQTCSENWLTLYCYSVKGDFLWRIEDYSKKFNLGTAPIEVVYTENQYAIVYTQHHDLRINLANGEVESLVVPRW